MKKIENMSKKRIAELDKLLENFKSPYQHTSKEDVMEHVSFLLKDANDDFVRHLRETNR